LAVTIVAVTVVYASANGISGGNALLKIGILV
jgi:hypothetical protein